LREMPTDLHAKFIGKPFFCDHCSSDAHGGLTRRGPSTTARIADAVFVPVGVVGMPRAELLGDPVVILASRVGVADQQRDRRARCDAFVNAGQELDGVGFVASGSVP
jgi:hypothetical protein